MDSNHEPGLFDGSTPIQKALEQLRLRLLDLTGRNRLLNFKHSPGRSLQLVPGSLNAKFVRLTGVQTPKLSILPVPDPTRDDWIEKNGRMVKPDAKEFAAKLGIDINLEGGNRSSDSGAQALYYSDDLAKHCRKLDREARLAIEETGANMLYLVFAYLEYPDSRDSERQFQAPLVCVPVRLDHVQEGPRVSFKVAFTGEEVEENLSLREKLSRDYNVTLPTFPEEEDGIEDYLEAVAKLCTKLPGWRVRRMLSLALLSFSSMLLVRDLDPEHWEDEYGESILLDHPVIKQVFEGRSDSSGIAYAAEYDLDSEPDLDFPIIFDADSSQHSAMVDVMKGRTMVIEGPPGTGKSQTITNIIAACLAANKSVLFVAEKLAALQVVKSRLQQAGLDPFILELHSNKTSKKQVLDSIATRLSKRAPSTRDIDIKESTLQAKKTELRRHAQQLQSQSGSLLGCTVHEILWRAEKSRMALGDLAERTRSILVEEANSTNLHDYRHRFDQIRYLAKQYAELGSYGPERPLWGFFPHEIAPGDDLLIAKGLNESLKAARQAEAVTGEISGQFGFGSNGALDPVGVHDTASALKELEAEFSVAHALDILPRLFSEDASRTSDAVNLLNECEQAIRRIVSLEDAVAGRIHYARVGECLASSADLEFSQLFSLQEKDLGSFKELTSRLGALLDEADSATAELCQLSSDIGLTTESERDRFVQFATLVSVATKCPVQLLELRHEGLFARNAVEVLDRAAAERERLSSLEARLNQELYLDQLPTRESLRESILVLREGSTWYRWFQSKWRKAVNAHKKLQRRKIKKPSDARLEELESLAELLSGKDAWLASAPYRSACGTSYDGFETPLSDLHEVALWIREGREALDRTGVENPEIQPQSISAERVSWLRSNQTRSALAANVLSGFDARYSSIVGSKAPDTEGVSWTGRLASLRNAAQRFKGIGSELSKVARDSESVERIFSDLEMSREILKTGRELHESKELAVLLGAHHGSLKQDIEAIVGAMKFGTRVASTSLPFKMKAMLWSEMAGQTISKSKGLVSELQAHWATVSQGLGALKPFGRVEFPAWVMRDTTSARGIESTRQKLEAAADGIDELQTWAQYNGARANCHSLHLADFVEILESNQVPSQLLADAYAFRFHGSIAESLFRQTPGLRGFSATRHNNVRADFVQLDKELVALRGKQIAAHSIRSAKPPSGVTGARVDDKTEMHLIELLTNQVRPRVTVRALLRRAGEAVRQLKPCFMMGPQAVAQFLEPSISRFDVVIMDEASQLKPEEAIGAIARGSQLVVVGDPKQLPPTSFFTRAQPADDDSQVQMAAVDAESILDVATTHFPPVRSLRWHYRSRHESLIAFSNHHFYGGSLVVFPSPFPKSKSLGVRSHYVSGAVYENQMNQLEATRTVDFVVDHIQNRPNQSLGVVTLNIRQRDLIAELLEERLPNLRGAEAFREKWEEEGQGLFVKNLENVQGDERDAIIISTTFGRPPGASRPHQNFGPISQQGGWRRLNVLFTRARRSVLVVTSLKDTDVVVNEAQTPRGTKALRDYLIFAETGTLRFEAGIETESEPESEFEYSVIAALRHYGYECVPQVGVASFRIDIGVRHPNYPHLFLAGIECDGASYHSGVTVRDRDRIRQEILESLGWKGKLYRIWSTEWFRKPQAELSKLISFLESLKLQEVDPEIIALINEASASSTDDFVATDEAAAKLVQQQVIALSEDALELEVEVGDLVGYIDADSSSGSEMLIRIAEREHDTSQGIVSQHTPLAQALLGALVDDTVEMRVPGHPDRHFRITRIDRPIKSVT